MSKDYRHSNYDDYGENSDFHFKNRNKGSNKYMNRRNRPKSKSDFRHKHQDY